MAVLIAAITLLFGGTAADARNITLTGSNYFYTANNAEIGEQQVGGDDGTYYTTFLFTEEDSAVTYRKNLAYHWYASIKDSDGEPTATVEEGFLSTEIGFTTMDDGKLPFATFTIRFQSQQYSETKDGVTSNYIRFVANEAGTGVYVLIGDEDAVDVDTYQDIEEYEDLTYLENVENITISFVSYASGEYTVEVTDGTDTVEGTFTNVGGSYAQYVSSSSSTSVIPLTYSATFAEGNDPSSAEDSCAVGMILYSFNGQSFALSGSGGYVTDDVPPVLCLNEVLTTLRYGQTIDVDYAVIDMLATSPRSTLYYYVLTGEQVEEGTDGSYNYEYDTTSEDGDDKFIETSSSDDAVVIRESGAYTVRNDGDEDSLAYVKVYFKIQDSTASSGATDWVCLDWYVEDSYLFSINDASFLRAVSDKQGATYSDGDETDYETIIAGITEKYQDMVNDALEEQEASAGDGNYFYLPSFEQFVSDNYTDYTSLNFSIYYLNSSSGSSTSLAYNELSIELDEEGYYKFAIYVTDAEGNEMWYIDEDGNVVTISASDIADLLENPANSKLNGVVPVFDFTVHYVGLSVETPGAQDIAFYDSEYTASSFDITGLSSNYTATYTLYKFDLAQYYEDTGNTLTYAEFISMVEGLFNDAGSYTSYFSAIKALADMEETDSDYDDYADYEWDPDSLSFVPQDENTFYVIVLTVSDNKYATSDVQSLMCINVSAAAASLPGESDWLENNIASVVLLCVAGAALIGIVLLIVIKPREKGDIDVIDQNDTKKSKGGRKSRKKAD